ncbi:DNA repair helicase Rad25 [Encephalitozoon intestinalis ATCC 50506]|uniref:DNA 3'-5' helicase n=1 Tax=Encephalitozoon intestinalis (strain ATCC 50506) TaxID=876142 RepID=E0S5H4_ENCIT|nr:DNA repair helicase Rad25 [Encephalitozoon intestinalis ATCC 50506]ADM10959.1 DNA repair helicase Rad25 [Encephalitozoon intestinalis ATCC 50506]UTX44595.1 DNA repair helicase Rad25 [Encephalitozoon intestinalis]
MNELVIPKKATKHQFPYEELVLKEDNDGFPMWVNYDGLIILEMFRESSRQACDFLIAIAEPVSRPLKIHEFQITAYSLYAAVSVGLTTDDIIKTLDRFSKNYLPRSVKVFITECTLSYGKVKLILKENSFFLEAANESVYKMLSEDTVIRSHTVCKPKEGSGLSIEVEDVELVKKRCIEVDYPLIEEYDFRNDKTLRSLQIDLKPTTIIRSYQEICLNKMFGNGRARSGIIVLPCGSGKTIVGITAISTIKKSCLVLCTSAVSVEQWKQQTLQFTNISPENVGRFTSDHKEWPKDDCGIVVTTYTMLAYTGKRSYEAQKIMDLIRKTEWGLLVLDEVHVVPAMMFRRVLSLVGHHCKLGLTATLVREDDKIEDLNFLIGPKLYEADWQDLSAKGHIARVSCVEVWCRMTGDFYREYLSQPTRRRRLLSIMNPTKFQMCEYLINKHESRGDKIIVFSDSVYALKAYALKLGKPFIYGPTGQTERMRILKQFQTNPVINTIFLSKVGDTSIDLPEATCLIQISSHFGSRRQEAQRLGRILRAKRRNDPDFKVYFYSLVSKDTDEMFYSNKRQQFLIDQGYTFTILTDIPEAHENEHCVYRTKGQQRELLAGVLLASEKELESEESGDEEGTIYSTARLKSFSGGDEMAYIEKKTLRSNSSGKGNKKNRKLNPKP